LRPARVDEIEGAVFVTHVEVGGFYDATIHTRVKRALLSSLIN
jgi:hypothetical protein